MPVGGAHAARRRKATAEGAAAFDGLRTSSTCRSCPRARSERVVQQHQARRRHGSTCAQATLQGWVPTSERTTFWVTTNPYGESFEHLSYLVHYPYGCIEQTTSSTRPLLFVSQLVEQVDPQLAEQQDRGHGAGGHQPRAVDADAVGRLRLLAGRDRAARVGHRLRDAHAARRARSSGYAVPEDRLDDVLDVDREPRRAVRARRGVAHSKWNHYDEQSRGLPALRARARRQGPQGAHRRSSST